MIYDVSVPIANGMPVWPSDPPLKLTSQGHLSRDKTHTVQVTGSRWDRTPALTSMRRFISSKAAGGWNRFRSTNWSGRRWWLSIPGAPSIQRKYLASLNWAGVQRVLFKTDNSGHWNDGTFYEKFVYLEPDAAEFLVEQGVRLVGIDYLSIDPYKSEKHPTHFVLLPRNVIIIEGLNLAR